MKRESNRLLAVAVGLGILVLAGFAPAAAGAPPQRPDTAGTVGFDTSLELDAAGNPVISYNDLGNGDLKLVHCNDPACAGGDENPQSPDTAGNVGSDTSLDLDAAGNPVISYLDNSNGDLKLVHCNDPGCAGGDDTPQIPDTAGGIDTSLELDAAGNPVIGYLSVNLELRVLQCNDPACAGGNETPQSPDTTGVAGAEASLKLDAAGNPVISYHDITNGDLRLLHCNDPACAGGDESLQSPDTAGIVGRHTSLELDAAGNPVISYWDYANGDLKVLHCNDPACAGGDDTPQSPDTGGNVGRFTSLELDAAGNPVISYYDDTNSDLRVLHCNEPACAGGDDIPQSPDTAGVVGQFTSLELDAAGNPVISYYDGTDGDLKLLHCDTPDCSAAPPPVRVPDHFLRYQLAQPEASGETVTLVDQFGSLTVRLEEAEWLWNPAEKRRTGRPVVPLQRADEHLVCYGLPYISTADRIVAVRNQFTASSTLRVGRPVALCTPAAKTAAGVPGPPPSDLDHYLCYDVRGETPLFPSETLGVGDQFGSRSVRIDRTREFCNPVEKRRTGRPPELITRPQERYVCYRITTQTPAFTPLKVFTRDQFALQTLHVSTLQRLCVPST